MSTEIDTTTIEHLDFDHEVACDRKAYDGYPPCGRPATHIISKRCGGRLIRCTGCVRDILLDRATIGTVCTACRQPGAACAIDSITPIGGAA